MPVARKHKVAIVQRRQKVADLYLQAWTQMAIAAHLGCGQTTVSADLRRIQAEWRRRPSGTSTSHGRSRFRRSTAWNARPGPPGNDPEAGPKARISVMRRTAPHGACTEPVR